MDISRTIMEELLDVEKAWVVESQIFYSKTVGWPLEHTAKRLNTSRLQVD